MRLFVFILLYLNIQLILTTTTAAAADDDDENVVTCDYSDTEWQPLNTQLFTCDIFTNTIDSPNFKIKFEPEQSERVEGLRFNDNKNMNFLPSNIGEIFPNLKGIIGTHTYLNTITSDDFKGLTKLKYLNLANSDLKVIEKNTFADLVELEELDLSDSDIRFIDENAFHGMTSLKTMYLGANKINHLETRTFEGLSSLESLSLELNHLEHVDDNLFSTNENLADIWMNGNKIVSISSKVFESMPKLSYVDLQANPCIDGVYDESNFDELKETLDENCASTHIVQKVYHKAKNVIDSFFTTSSQQPSGKDDDDDDGAVREEFNIDGDVDSGSGVFSQFIKFIKSTVDTDDDEKSSDIQFKNDPSTKTVECSPLESDVKTCEINDQLIDSKNFKIIGNGNDYEAMSLAQNKHIKFLPENIGKFSPNLLKFSARNASLQVLSKKNFAGLNNLRSLNLADNRIKHIDPDTFDDLTSLEELDLSGNELQSLDYDVFAKLKNLKTLRIGNNKFHSIHPNLFRNLRNLVNVSISHQQIEIIPEKLFNANPKLQNVWMNSNKLKSISPNMFEKLRALEYVDMRDNKCIDIFYDESKFTVMKDEILEKCGKGYELKKGVKNEESKKKKGKTKKEKKNKKKKQKLPKQPSITSEEEKEVICNYEDIFWPNVNKTLRTCVINDQSIDDENYFLNANLAQFDDFTDVDKIQAISFANNKNMRYLPKGIADVFPNLIEFSAANSALMSIKPDRLKGLHHLKTLNLAGNGLASLEPETFKDLTSLEELTLDDNDIEEIEEEIFTYTKVLKKLRMKGNKLNTVEESWFEWLPELHDFSFDITDGYSVDLETFRRAKKLKWIQMNGEFYDSNMQPIADPSTLVHEHEVEEIIDSGSDELSFEIDDDFAEIACNYLEEYSAETEEIIKVCEIDDSQIIDSANYKIKFSPQNEDVRAFIIKHNANIKFLPQFENYFPNLEEIRVTGTPLSSINRKAFKNLPHLKRLILNKNMIKSFEYDTFEDLPELEELNLAENSIGHLEDGVFYKLPNLKYLNLGKNDLHHIHPKIFKFLNKLNTLSLDDNHLSVLDPQLFKYNPDLKVLNFDNNFIENLNPKVFENLRKLTTVSLKGNNCVDGNYDFTEFANMKNSILENCKTSVKSKKKEIYCDFKEIENPENESDETCVIDEYNIIDDSDYNVMIDMHVNDPHLVETFSISNNDKIKYFPQNVGEMFPNLINFYATNDSLEKIPANSFNGMKNVRKLNLSKNKLKEFDPDTFDDLLLLEELDLSDNDIDVLNENTLPKLPKLKKINLIGNDLKYIDPKAFKNMPELAEVTFSINSEDIDINSFDVDNDDVEFNFEEIEHEPDRSSTKTSKEKSKPDDSDHDDDDTHDIVPEKTGQPDEITSDEIASEEISTEIDNEDEDEVIQPHENALDEDEKIKSNEESSEEPIVDDDSSENHIPVDSGENKPDSHEITPDIEESNEATPSISYPSSSEDEEKLVHCDLDFVEWKSDDDSSNIFTCIINEQPIDDKNFKIQTTDDNTRVQGVKIDDNKNVMHLPENIGSLFPNLKKLSARNNSIINVPQDALKDLNNLQTLDLSDNDIDVLDEEMFSDAPYLEEIDISGNKIKEIPETIFFNSPSLQKLILNNNEITTLPLEIFEKIPNLVSLTIDNNIEVDENLVKINPHLDINVVGKEESVVSTTEAASIDEQSQPTISVKESTTTVFEMVPSTTKETPTATTPRQTTKSTTTTTRRPPQLSTATTTTTHRTTTASTTRRPFKTASTTRRTTTSTTRRTTTTTQSSVKFVTCEIINELSEFQDKNVMKCDMTDQEIDDPEVSLKENPYGKDVKVLKLDNNKNIKYLPDNIYEIFPNLIEVSAKNANIDSILPGDFQDLKKLENIDLSGNEIKSIEPDTFGHGLNALKNLDLSSNGIEFIDEDGFGDLPKLQNLNLEDNDIKFIHPKTFQNIPNLQTLNIDNNDIPQLHEDVFKMNPKLKNVKHSIKDFKLPLYKTTSTTHKIPVRISTPFTRSQTTTSRPQTSTSRRYPQINYFPTSTTTARSRPQFTVTRPKEIECEYGTIYWNHSDEDLFSCDLKDVVIDDPYYTIKPSLRNKRVKGLSFVDNKNVKFLPQNLAATFPNLVEISAFNTSIRNIPNDALKNLTKLKSLNLMSSEISSIDQHAFDGLPLENLDISNNNLYDLSPETFKKVPMLKSLYIFDNKLRDLDPKIFENLPDLRNISLENNKLPEINKKLFGKNYELQNVWLNGNRINAIDNAIFDGKRALEYVDLRGNECIDDFFEGYGIEGMRNKLKSSCKTPEEVYRQRITTSTSRPSYTYSVFEVTTDRRRVFTDSTTRYQQFPTKKPELETTTWRYSQPQPTIARGPSQFFSQPIYPQRSTVPTTTTTTTTAKSTTVTLLKEVKCSLNYHEFPNSPSPIYTCIIDDQPISDQGYVIKSTPHNNHVQGLAIDDNDHVEFLPQNINEIFPNLKYFSARNNSINNVFRDNFDNLNALKNLDLSDNSISTIDPETFNLPSVEELNLSGNNIPFIFNEAFTNFPNLKDLDLSRNEIETINPGVFKSLPELKKLSLENNEITDLPENLFEKNPRLENINLSGNKISQLSPIIFQHLPYLKEVNLEENDCIGGTYKNGAFNALKIDIIKNCTPESYMFSKPTERIPSENRIVSPDDEKSVECEYKESFSPYAEDYQDSCYIEKKVDDPNWKIKDMPANKRVKRVVIDNNKDVEKLPNNLAESFPELSDLVISNSPLKSISPNDLRNLNKLNTISITDTSLKNIDENTFSGAPNVRDINLSNNNLRSIDDDAFNGLPNLQNLDLSGNKIPKLTQEVFKNLPQLKTLKLTGNDLESINGDLFKKNQKLFKINLDDNNLKNIDPDAFDKLPHLMNVDLSKNECIDRDFGTSTMHMMRQIVNENCRPYKELKNELKSCKKEIASCKNELASKPNEIQIDDGENEKLRDLLQKAEIKTKQLNIQINKLRKALDNEKDSLNKEVKKSRELQSKLDQAKHKCAKIDENHNFIIDLNCDYDEDIIDNKYSCMIKNLKIVMENTTIEDIKGNHKNDKSNYDVSSLIISNQDMKFLPNDISSQFPYLRELIIDNSKLKNINQIPLRKFPYLTKLIIKGNDIDKIDPNAFNDIPQLEHLDLSQNNIKELPVKIFDKLPNLKVLNLNDNGLLTLPQDIVPMKNKLQEFTVSNNNLNFIDPRLFKKLIDAKVIDFTNNKCIDEKFDANVGDKGIDFMAFSGRVNVKCLNNDDDDDDENGNDTFCKGRKASVP